MDHISAIGKMKKQLRVEFAVPEYISGKTGDLRIIIPVRKKSVSGMKRCKMIYSVIISIRRLITSSVQPPVNS
jgi:hypothetical protein